jgi:hypothetical protein
MPTAPPLAARRPRARPLARPGTAPMIPNPSGRPRLLAPSTSAQRCQPPPKLQRPGWWMAVGATRALAYPCACARPSRPPAGGGAVALVLRPAAWHRAPRRPGPNAAVGPMRSAGRRAGVQKKQTRTPARRPARREPRTRGKQRARSNRQSRAPSCPEPAHPSMDPLPKTPVPRPPHTLPMPASPSPPLPPLLQTAGPPRLLARAEHDRTRAPAPPAPGPPPAAAAARPPARRLCG